MPSIHIQYADYFRDIQPVLDDLKLSGLKFVTRDLYDNSWFSGTMSFDFETEEDAMLFKLKFGGKYRPRG